MELAEFRWIGQGPYAGYPGKDRLNEFGLFHLNRAVERDGDKTLLKHNAVISCLGNKIGRAESLVNSAKVGRISGSFTLVPTEDAWPAALTRWFGKPAAAREVFRPFYHSYDQGPSFHE